MPEVEANSEAITTLSVPEAKAVGVAEFLVNAGVPFSARPVSVKGVWVFAVEREDDDVFSILGALHKT